MRTLTTVAVTAALLLLLAAAPATAYADEVVVSFWTEDEVTVSTSDYVTLRTGWMDIISAAFVEKATDYLEISVTISRDGEPVYVATTEDGTWTGVYESDEPGDPSWYPSPNMPQRAFENHWYCDVGYMAAGECDVECRMELTKTIIASGDVGEPGRPTRLGPTTWYNEFTIHAVD